MERVLRITLFWVPVVTSVILVLTIVSNGSDLVNWIDDVLRNQFGILLSQWDMDHLTFGFCIGLPPAIVVITLTLFKQLRIWRLILGILFFYLAQILFVVVLAYFLTNTTPTFVIGRYYVSAPNPDFWNYALIISFILSYTILFSAIFFSVYRFRKTTTAPLDSDD